MTRPLLMAVLFLLALAGVAGAQITAPESRPVAVKEFSWSNERDSLFSAVVLNDSRLDTLPEISMRLILEGVVGDSSHCVFGLTMSRRGYPLYMERDTVPIWAELPLPRKNPHAYLPDSLVFVYLLNCTPVVGSELNIKLAPVDPDQGYFLPIVFASDTVRGTATDTSAVLYLGRGVKEAVFGFRSSVATPEITYELLYNLGEGWGYANPSDTLAGKTWTDDISQNTWGYRDVGALLNSTFCRVIRRGEAAADTGQVRQSIRLSPR